MGIIYKVSCPVCGYQTQLNLEGGLSSINLKRSISVLPAVEKDKILKMMEEGKIDHFHIENQITVCQKCKTLKDNTIIELRDRLGENYLFNDVCSECGTKMEIMKYMPGRKVSCPKCGKADMGFRSIGLWD